MYIDKCSFLGVYYTFFQEQINDIQKQLGYLDIANPLLNDLVLIRIFEPTSKLKSIELLDNYFGIQSNRQTYYRFTPNWAELKKKIETKTIEFAKERYRFEFEILFYDVTTLYFESFTEDDLRKNGFSKDGKS